MKVSQILLLCLLGLLVFSCIISFSLCQDEDDTPIDVDTTTTTSDESPIEQQLPVGEETLSGHISSPDITASSLLLTKDKVSLAEPAEVLIGLKNTGEGDEATFRIQYAKGYLISSIDPSFIIQNFTGMSYNVTLSPSQSASLSYSFVASPQLEARDYTVAVEVFYVNANKDTFGTIAFNQTINFVAKEESLLALGSLVQIAMIIGMIGLVAYGVLQAFSGSKYSKKRVGGSVTTSTGDQVSEDKMVNVGNEKVNMDFIPASHRVQLEKLQKKKNKQE